MAGAHAKKADNINIADLGKNGSSANNKIAPNSAEIVIGLVGYAGAGCTAIATALYAALDSAGYEPHPIKLSSLIEKNAPPGSVPQVRNEVPHKGRDSLNRAKKLQDAGDSLREGNPHRLASLSIDEIRRLRGERRIGENRIAYILDSLKNLAEVELLREVYGTSFRLMAVHCDRDRRLNRLFGDLASGAKFAGAERDDVEIYMDRDEKDGNSKHGQQVRDVFHLADYFIDDNVDEKITVTNNYDLKRFFEIVLGRNFHRPTPAETAMYSAFSTALRSSCLSRQVGAALLSPSGQLVAVGSNDVPRYGGGTYLEGQSPDHRCAAWEWHDPSTGAKFIGCHNSRHKKLIETEISAAIAAEIGPKIGAHLSKTFKDIDINCINDSLTLFFEQNTSAFSPPRVKDLIEYSRSIHAEMDALFSALREGVSPVGGTLFCTTFPCHNCARHLVAAGIKAVYYVEPYVKSLAVQLHEDSIQTVSIDENERQEKLLVLPFTGVGPRMYEDHFIKRGELKDASGRFQSPEGVTPISGARLGALDEIEKQAAELARL